MAITSTDQVLAAISAATAESEMINKTPPGSMTTGFPFSWWRMAGTPAQGAIPGAAAICNKATLGSLGAFASPVGSNKLYILRAGLLSTVSANGLVIVDRLCAMGGLSGTSTSVQTVNLDPAALGVPAARLGKADLSELQWDVEVYTDIGASSGITLTINYVRNSDGAARTSVITFLGVTNSMNRLARIHPIIPQPGEIIRSITSVQWSATTGTAGSFGITCRRNLTGIISFPQSGTPVERNAFDLGLPEVPDNACLAMIGYPNTGTAGAIMGDIRLGQG